MKKNNKLKKIFYLNILLITIIIILIVFVFIYITKNTFTSSILTIIALILVILLLNNNQKFEYERHIFTYKELINDKKPPYLLSEPLILKSLINKLLESLDYHEFKSNAHGYLLYKIDKSFSNKKRHKTLFAFKVVKDNSSFKNSMSLMFDELEDSLYKKSAYQQRFFIQFKEINDSITTKVINDADNIFFLNKRNATLVILNVVYSKTTKEYYFLHSNAYQPMLYLRYASDYINELINKEAVKK